MILAAGSFPLATADRGQPTPDNLTDCSTGENSEGHNGCPKRGQGGQETDGEICMISVYGADQPGIVYRVTRELAACNVNITDLNTKLIGTSEEPVYVMMLEVALPEGQSAEGVEQLLADLKNELKVEIGVRVVTPVAF